MIDSHLFSLVFKSLEEKKFPELVQATLDFAKNKYPHPLHSRHEGLGVLLEELEELKQTIFQKQSRCDILVELASVAAVCQRMAEDVIYVD
jgi:hypothetical protein